MPADYFEQKINDLFLKKSFLHIDENQSNAVVDFVISLKPFPKLITLEGDLGSGKTALVKKLIGALDSADAVSSPTFSLVNEYKTAKGESIFHSDWYRVKDLSELYDAGIDEYVFGNTLFIVEWPEIGASLLEGESQLKIKITHQDHSRDYHLEMVHSGLENTPTR